MTRTRSPEALTPLPGGLGWLVTDRAVAVRLLGDDRLGVLEPGPVMAALTERLPAADRPLADELTAFAGRIMLQAAPERHAVLRKAFGPFFDAAAVARLTPAMRAAAERVVAPFVAAGGGEFMTAVAFRYAAEVGAVLLGVPAASFLRLHKLSQRLAMVAYAAQLPDPSAAVREGHAALAAIRELVADGRATAPSGSVLAAWNEGRTDGLSDADFEANTVMLVQASLETVAGTVGNAAVRILGTDGALADPAARDRLLDEALRYEPPLKTLERVAREPLSVAGLPIRRGQVISVRVADVNRVGPDPVAGRAVFSFGWGAYRCLGARLARHEALELFEALHTAAPDSVLASSEIERVRHIRFDMPRRLMVRCAAPGSAAAAVERALTDALAEHDLRRRLTSLEYEVAVLTLRELGLPEPDADERPLTIEEWVTWATSNRG